MISTTSRLLGYVLGIACVFGCSASIAVAAFPGWGTQKMSPMNYRWRPVAPRPASVPAASRSYRSVVHRTDPRRRIAPPYSGYYSPRFVRLSRGPFPAAGSDTRYAVQDRWRPPYASLPPSVRPAVSPISRPMAYYNPPRPPRYAASPRTRGDRQKSQPQILAGYRFRPLTERERHRMLRRGVTPIGVRPFAFSGSNPRTEPLFKFAPRRYARVSAGNRSPVWNSGSAPRWHRVPAPGRSATRGSRFASVPVRGAES